jgi:hypothetical protein
MEFGRNQVALCSVCRRMVQPLVCQREVLKCNTCTAEVRNNHYILVYANAVALHIATLLLVYYMLQNTVVF